MVIQGFDWSDQFFLCCDWQPQYHAKFLQTQERDAMKAMRNLVMIEKKTLLFPQNNQGSHSLKYLVIILHIRSRVAMKTADPKTPKEREVDLPL